MLDINSGLQNRAQKIIVYGPEGIGKTTLASKMPNPLFIDVEGGTTHLDVRRLRTPRSFEELVNLVFEVSKENTICDTLVIDTADWAEQLCVSETCRKYRKTGIEDFGFGKGYVFLAEEFAKLIDACDKVIDSGINVVFLAHAKITKFELPEERGAYDRWELKLSKKVKDLISEWCDALLFCNYKIHVVTTSTQNKVEGGTRVIYTSHHPCWDAKNRVGLRSEVDMTFQQIKTLFVQTEKSVVKEPTVYDKLFQKLKDSNISESDLRKLVASKKHYSYNVPISEYSEDFINRWAFANWDKIIMAINGGKN